MASYNFKRFFKEKLIHNDDYVSNAHFIIKKSILKKLQIEYINGFDKTEDKDIIKLFKSTIKRELEKPVLIEFTPSLFLHLTESNIVIMKYDNKYYGINEKYYNYIQSLSCKINITSELPHEALSIYKYNNFMGIIYPMYLKDEYSESMIDYNEYLAEEELQAQIKRKSRCKNG